MNEFGVAFLLCGWENRDSVFYAVLLRGRTLPLQSLSQWLSTELGSLQRINKYLWNDRKSKC